MARYLLLILTSVSINVLVILLYLIKFKTRTIQDIIPVHINQMRLAESKPPIPRHVIQVSQSKLNDSLNSSFVRLNPDYVYRSFGDREADKFVHEHMPANIVQIYKSMPKTIFKSDFFRYISVMVLGGVYSDMDTECLHPIDTWMGDQRDRIGLIVSLEMDDPTNWKGFVRPLQFCQWTFAAIPNHPILQNTVNTIVALAPHMLAQSMSSMIVMNWTGPGLWSDVIIDYLHQQFKVDAWKVLTKLKDPILIGDVYILPKDTFGSYSGRHGNISEPKARVRHFFTGGWKKDRDLSG